MPVKPLSGVLDIAPYVPGAAGAPGAQKVYKLSANESALGASPKAGAAYRGLAMDGLHLYPDGSANALREAIGAAHQLDPARIFCGAGSDEILQLLMHTYVGRGDNIVQTRHGFLMYSIFATGAGAEVRYAPEKELTADVDALLEAVNEKTKAVFLANPNNPTGTYIPYQELERLRQGLRDDILLVIDAAYAEYIEQEDYGDPARLVHDSDNTIMTRTFSKAYGLGALRLGWAYGPADMIEVLNRVRTPFNVNAAALAAGVAALEDQTFIWKNRAFTNAERARVSEAITGLSNAFDAGLKITPSIGNFLLVHFPDVPGKNADTIYKALAEGGVLVRPVGAYQLPHALRITIGDVQANNRLLDLLKACIAA